MSGTAWKHTVTGSESGSPGTLPICWAFSGTTPSLSVSKTFGVDIFVVGDLILLDFDLSLEEERVAIIKSQSQKSRLIAIT